VASQRRIHPRPSIQPEVYFLPLESEGGKQVAGLDVGMVARRIPDCLQQLINSGEAGPVGIVEPRSPQVEDVRAVVTGSLDVGHEGFEVKLHVHFRPDPQPIRSMTLSVPVSLRRPMPALTRLANRLAGILEIPDQPRAPLTHDTRAFYRFLAALDGAVPFSEPLRLDPGFGLALRAARTRLAAALETDQLDRQATCRILDDCLEARPTDGAACVQVAELFQRLGEDQRAVAWLEHAASLPGSEPRALEALGTRLVALGDRERARAVWQAGAELDGHPDFCAHLAQLAFEEGNLEEAWAQVWRGLRRVVESLHRRQEWPVDRRHAARLLQGVAGQIGRCPPPAGLSALLGELRGRLLHAEERVELARCLLQLGLIADARSEIQAALGMDLALSTRDRAVRIMLALDVPGFERRFEAAVKAIRHGPKPGRGMSAMREFLIRQPEFWPALFHLAIGLRRQGHEDEALDILAEVLHMRPGQVETLVEMAELFAARGNPKRALECMDEAIQRRGREARLHLSRAEYLERLDRRAEAAAAVDRALELEKSGGQSLAATEASA
jgi:tetratricopeptide (TPR) repeat protein